MMTPNDPLKELAYKIYRACFGSARDCHLETAFEMGMLRPETLEDGAQYRGHCRNAYVATWDHAQNCFVIDRVKFGNTFKENVDYPNPKAVFDVFVPVAKIIAPE